MSVSLTPNMRNSLNALQTITSQSATAQARLSSGLKVSSAIDNPNSFFTAQGLNNRASDLGNLLDGIGNGTKVLKAADDGIKAITALVQTAKGLASAAKQADAAGRTALAVQYTAIMAQITTAASDASFNGINLIKGTPDALKVTFNEDGNSKLDVAGVALDKAGLSLVDAAWNTTADVDTDIGLLDKALGKLRSTAASFGANSAIVTARQDFTKNLISTLKEGADSLVLADQNEEASNLLALQTRQQLAQTSLSLANQSQQAILRLF